MQNARDFLNALLTALLSIGLVMGALSISLVGFIPEEAPTPTVEIIVSPPYATTTNTAQPTFTLMVLINTPTFTATNTIQPPLLCPPPAGWLPLSVQAGDTLDGLAQRYRTTRETLRGANCLVSDESLIAGKIIYVPPAPTSTPVACIAGAAGWVRAFIVQKGDTFYNIGARYGYTASLIKQVNCRESDLIFPGEVLWVPNVPTRTPTQTPPPGITYTPAILLTEPFTQTVLPFTATIQPSATLVPATPTPISTPTAIPTQTASPTP